MLTVDPVLKQRAKNNKEIGFPSNLAWFVMAGLTY